jgi:RHS repeat-associated protein
MPGFSMRLVRALLALWLLLGAGAAQAVKCDVDGNGRIDRIDIGLIQQATLAKSPVSGPDDPRDADNNGVINAVDSRICALRCKYLQCATNGAPLANAGAAQTVRVGDTVQLSGAASSDPDGDLLGYRWSFVSRPAGSTAALSGANTVNPRFVVDRAGNYVVGLVVNDGQVDSASASVTISTRNSAPVANAGPAQTGRVGDTVTLDGRGSADVDGDALSYRWRIVGAPPGSTAALQGANTVQPQLVLDSAGTWRIELVVNDGQVDSAPAEVLVSTVNSAPVARAGTDRSVSLGALVPMDGSASTDVDGDALSYRWSFSARPAGSNAILSNPNIVNPSFTADVPGTFVLQLVVNDGQVDSAPASVSISTDNAAPSANAGPDQSVALGARVQLDGSASRDPEGAALSYAWSFVSRPAGSAAVLDNPGSATPSFVADRAGDYVVQLIVSDGVLGSTPDQVRVSTLNSRPLADAGAAQSVDTGATVQLDGSASRDADGDALSYSWSFTLRPAGSAAALSDASAVNPSFVADVAGQYIVQLIVSDGRLTSVPVTVSITASTPNRPPTAQAAASPDTVLVGQTVTLSSAGSADPDGNPISFLWSLSARPAGSNASIGNASSATASIVPDVPGSYTATLTVTDSLGASANAIASFTANPAAANTAPTANNDGYTTGEGVALQTTAATGVLANDRDAEADALTAELVSTTSNGVLVLQADGSFLYTPAAGFAGTDRFAYRARDRSLASGVAGVEIVVTPAADRLPLDLDLTISPTVVPVGGSVTITVAARGGRAPFARTLVVDNVSIPLDGNGQAVLSGVAAGPHRVTATVTDASGGSVTRQASYSGQVAGDSTAPTVSIASPTTGTELFGDVDVRGTANDANLVEYRLLFAPAGSIDLTEFARGTTPVINGVLGRLELTTLGNGLTDIVLEARDANGAVTRTKVTVEVIGDQKVGNFELTFEDLSIEAAGIPIAVTRTYSTGRRNQRLDFGYGWTIDYQNVNIQANRILGQDWTLSSSGGIIRTWCLRPNGPHTVSVTLPDGKVERFDMTVSPECQQIIPPQNVTAVFTARGGTRSRLTQDSGVLFVNGSELLDLGTVAPYDPTNFTLTTEDGYVYALDRNFGIRSVRDPLGNTLTYSSAGITHSGGQSVLFQRDGQGRITRITDPAGRSLEYAYNANGDLATVVDRTGQAARHRYNRSHGLVDFTDPRGVLLNRNVYDDSGRLIEQYDAAGNRIAFSNDTAARRQTVRDRRGFATTLEYDASGNVTRTVDALGGVSTSSFDARGNELSTTDPLGRVTTRSFSAEDRLLAQTDALGNRTSYSYSANGQTTAIVDPLGRRTDLSYAGNGNLTQVRDGAGTTTAMAYDGAGNLTQLTDGQGNITRYTYDSAGRRTAEQDPLGNTTRITYDANGKETSRTVTRTVGGTPVNLTTSRVLDANGNVLQETDPDGNVEASSYNGLSKLASRTDKLGRTTAYEYDVRGNETGTLYADGTRDGTEYDANGNEVARIDRAGRRTVLSYDALNRPTSTVLPDGSEQRRVYDAAGQLLQDIDARGNTTSYEYDAAGRRTRLVDAAGGVTTTSYDAAGNVLTVTDPRGNTVSHEYDAANRRTRTTFADGSFVAAGYDAVGRKTSETDAVGRLTRYSYDALGRLLSVTDAAGGITRYTYDELGNRLTQQDAAGRVTSWVYDNAGRVTRRTLPGGQSESFTYDARGNRLTHTDFNGATTRYAYDLSDRMVSRRNAGGALVTITYTATGMPATVTDGRGVTSYQYDALDRLLLASNPDGSQVRYAYDAAGNRTELTVRQGARPARTTRFAYDVMNRLTSVTSPDGAVTSYTYDAAGNRSSMTRANGTRTSYSYDVQNRLIALEHRRISDGGLLTSFAYTLAADGQRLRAQETLGGSTRTADYSYDPQRRLVREQVTDAARGNRVANYNYDAVGNRVGMTINGVATSYAYDANDRLVTEAVGGDTTSYTYDANGNMLERRRNGTLAAAYEWNDDGRLAVVNEGGQVTGYSYDAEGERVARTVGGVTTRFVVDKNREHSQVVEERAANGDLVVEYVRGDDLVSQSRGGVERFFHADALGSTRALTDAAAAVTDTWVYEAFGTELARTGTTPTELLFVGEAFDGATGLYYLRSRWMNPVIGRFVSRDRFDGWANRPISLNKYLYADADPVNLRDPSGQFSIGFSGFAGVIVSTAVRIGTPLIIQGGARALVGRILIQSAFRVAPTVATVSARQLVGPALLALTATAITLCQNTTACRPSISVYLAGRPTPLTTQHNFDALFGFGSNGSPISPFFVKVPRSPVNYNSRTTPHPPCTPPRMGSCDEYPYATAAQGGELNWAAGNVSLRVIPGEDGTQGGQLSSFYGACGVTTGAPFVAFGLPGVPAGYICSNGRARVWP